MTGAFSLVVSCESLPIRVGMHEEGSYGHLFGALLGCEGTFVLEDAPGSGAPATARQGIELSEPQSMVVAPVCGKHHPSCLGALFAVSLQGNREVVPIATDAVDDALCGQVPLMIKNEYAMPVGTADEDLEIVHPSHRVERAHPEGSFLCGVVFRSVDEQSSSVSSSLRPQQRQESIKSITRNVFSK